MRKAVLAVAAVLVVVSLVGLVLFFSEGGVSEGRGHGSQMMSTSVDLRGVWLLVFVVPLAIAAVVVIYGVLYPERKVEKKPALATEAEKETAVSPVSSVPVQTPKESSQTLEAVLRVLSPDERKVVEALAATENRTMLQKDIRWKTGLSRVKTHRVIARLVARRIVQVEKYYNTNKVVLADWVT
ncbi:MAG: hypothetical protein NWF00_10330 [Candidatus Bathyarchaeota archaeon]|nr:hypothetical protein [Candidatus Bathyarchaeota archaeon]